MQEINFNHSLVKKAKDQMDRYARGSLYGLELYDYRYIVLVSEKYLDITQEEYTDSDKHITYKIVNVACNPDTPSGKEQEQAKKNDTK